MAVAEWLGVAKSSVAVTAGGKSRLKTVAIAGEPAGLAARLASQLVSCSESSCGEEASIDPCLAQ